MKKNEPKHWQNDLEWLNESIGKDEYKNIVWSITEIQDSGYFTKAQIKAIVSAISQAYLAGKTTHN